MKQCTYCKKYKQETAFNWKQKHLKRASHCRDCSRMQIRSHYKKNTEYYVKKASISSLISAKASWKIIEQEIKKCDVRCANCHRKKTARQNNSWRLKHP